MTGRGPFKMSESWWGKGITGDTYVDALWDGTIEGLAACIEEAPVEDASEEE